MLELLENKGYTKFLLKFAMPLGSTYAQRFYEMFCCLVKTDMVHEWDKYVLWQKDDLLENIYQIVEKKKGQKLYIEQLEKYSHESIARLVF